MVGISCELDAFNEAHNCRPRGRLIRKSTSTTPVTLSNFSVQFWTQGSTVTSLPTYVTISVIGSGGATLGAQSFALAAVSPNVVALANPADAEAFINGYGQAVAEVQYESTDVLTATAVVGTNTIGNDAVVGGSSAGSASYSTYIQRLRYQDQT